MNVVELFSGTGSFSKVAAQLGHDVFRVEIDSKFESELNKDILEVQRDELPKKIDVIWCSPPCTTFSVASLSRYWTDGKPKNAKTWHGISMLYKTLSLIEEIKQNNPNLIWFVENPRGMMRRVKVLEQFHRKTVTYCQYGKDYMKPTDIWTNLVSWKSRPPCKAGDLCHEEARRSSKSGIQNVKIKGKGLTKAQLKSVVPAPLINEIFEAIEGVEPNNPFSEYEVKNENINKV